jgi:hypothetical protein
VFEMFNLYCERIGPGLWDEPVNAFTNIAFLVAAWLIWRLAKKLLLNSNEINLLIVLMGLIAIGSGLFHTFATGWAKILDLAPILLFQLIFLWVYFRQIAEMRPGYIAGILLVYFAASIAGMQLPHLLNGSLIYAPAALLVFAVGIYHCTSGKVERYLILAATLVFFISITFRTIDNAICPNFPLGSHFMWHLCNAITLYLLMRALLVNRAVEQ